MAEIELPDKRILVIGGTGFLGRHLVRVLRERGCTEILVPRRSQYDLTREAHVERLYAHTKPEIVIHLAAVGGSEPTKRTRDASEGCQGEDSREAGPGPLTGEARGG